MASIQQSRFALLALGLGTSLPAADSAVNVALPAIADALLTDPLAIRWTVIVYVLTYASLMMVLGAWGDRQGYWRVFRFGLWLGVLAYTWCSLAGSYGELLAGRFLQGFSSALLLSVGPALMVQCLGDSHPSRGIAVYGALSALAAASGPLIGGIMIDWLGWSGSFWFRVPVVALAMLCLGIASTRGFGLGPLSGLNTVASSESNKPNHADVNTSVNVVVLRQIFGEHCRGPMARAHALHAWAQSCGFTSMLLIPFFVTKVIGLSPSWLGLMLFAWPFGMVMGNSLGPWLIRQIPLSMCFRVGLILLALGGSGLAAICLGSGTQQDSAWPLAAISWAIGVCLLTQGMGLGLFQMLYTDWVLAQSLASQRGVAGAASLTSRTAGVILTALCWPALIAALLEHVDLTWSMALGLLYLVGSLSLLALLSQIPQQSISMRAHPR